jgi:hypothetical protein
VNGGEVGDEGGGARGRREREMARKAMRRWREPRATVIILAFFVRST